MTTYKNLLIPIFLILILSACKQGPKTAEPFSLTKISDSEQSADIIDTDLHEVMVSEVLPAEKYVYLKVQEKGKEYWIAAPKQDVEEGTSYVYNESLLKTEFESKEHNRVFDTLYMVTALVPKEHGSRLIPAKKGIATPGTTETIGSKPASVHGNQGTFRGSVKIDELITNAKEYEGDIVQITGECTKINLGIMDRNWIHIKDGSRDDYDLVITSQEEVQKGDTVTVRATVRLNADFGSGYSYELLLENGTLF
jgi:hypothetical protein